MSRYLAISTCRVSTSEQEENGSLDRQAEAVREAAKILDVDIPEDGQWSGSTSSLAGKNIHRPDLQEMLAYCKRNKRVKFLIVHEVDRFMRSMDELFYFEVTFQMLGVKIWYASQPELNISDQNAKLLKALESFKAEGSNVERQRKSIAGQTTAILQGRYTFHPKLGYMKGSQAGVHIIKPYVGECLKSSLRLIASDSTSPSRALKLFNDCMVAKSLPTIKMDKFRKIITDPYYYGAVSMDKQVKAFSETGLHESLITKAEHLAIIRTMVGKPKNQNGPHQGGNPNYPVSRLVTCLNCRKNISRYDLFQGVTITNTKKKSYEKYRCRGCYKYFNREEFHDAFKQLLSTVACRDTQKLLRSLTKTFSIRDEQRELDIKRLTAQINQLDKDLDEEALAASKPENLPLRQRLMSHIEKNELVRNKLDEQRYKLESSKNGDMQKFLDFALNFAEDVGQRILDVSQKNRELCTQMIFTDKIFMNRSGNMYTQNISPIYRLIAKQKDLSEIEKSSMVRVKRL